MLLNRYPEHMNIGDLVMTVYNNKEEGLVRRIDNIRKDSSFGSGYGATATRGIDAEGNASLGHPVVAFGTANRLIDAAWFYPYAEIVTKRLRESG